MPVLAPTISVVITTYNRPNVLEGAIRSVLSQEDVDFELLVIDDASPGTETERVVIFFNDPRIRYIRHTINQGSTASMNTGLAEAGGAYIAILDDDDVWISKDKLSKQMHFLNSHPDFVLVSTNIVVTEYNSENILIKTNAPQYDKDIRKHFLSYNPIAHSSVLYRKDIALSVGGYDVTLARGKDYDLWLKMGKKGKVHILPDHMVRYREATFAQRDIIAMRIKDTRAKIRVIRRHKKSYPGALAGLLQEYLRFFVFVVLKYFLRFFITRK